MTDDNRLDLNDLKRMSAAKISNAMAAEVLRMDPGRLAQYAREGKLGWNTETIGTRVMHSREDFIRFWSGEPEKPQERSAEDLLMELIELIRVQNTMLMEIGAVIKDRQLRQQLTD